MAIFVRSLLATGPWLLPICIIVFVAGFYLVKYWVLKFAGWITGHRAQTGTYIFIVFLVNKMIALALVPLVIVGCRFSAGIGSGGVDICVLCRHRLHVIDAFLWSYGLLQHGIQGQSFSFLSLHHRH